MIINPETFALAVVQSSDSALTVVEKLELFKEAYQTAKKHNQPIIDLKINRKQSPLGTF
ncbi:TPA: hypothetical protein TXT63_001075 [Streptococcus suis]|uniref:Uncharacterized protein n=1 Tax=Streptococcus suis TaxID=1307 RepID=A0AB33UAB7_STRSU|nr:hypothetical protein [Streptococcus suis]NQS31397.1 hypothetical protein [Streptococcus suis]QBX21632.1 hypothetical protein Javan585_0006 [Streptococcus phage Javan585]CYX52867.1 Uncharacterised protein [Streptococcus suis]HEL1761409.1 hypothetical protein [Streptococcus suis]